MTDGFSRTMEETGNVAPDFYAFFDLPWDAIPIIKQYLPHNPVIVEAGAFDGNESRLLCRTWPQGQVHSFEPVRQLYRLVAEKARHESNLSVYRLALGDRCELRTMYLSHDPQVLDRVSMSSSLLPPKEHLDYASMRFDNSEIVQVVTLDQWAEQHQINQVDMLWLDMQGYELQALKAAPRVLSNVSVVLTELEFVEAYAGQPLYQEVKNWLEGQGFVLIAGNFRFPKAQDQWFGDGLFVRRELLKQ